MVYIKKRENYNKLLLLKRNDQHSSYLTRCPHPAPPPTLRTTQTTANAARVLQAAGVENVNVVSGQKVPLLRSPRHDPGIHGESGLDGTDLLPSTAASQQHLEEWKEKKVGSKVGLEKYSQWID